MKKNILLIVFVSLLQPMCVWGMEDKQLREPFDFQDEILKKRLPDPFTDKDTVFGALFVFFTDKILLEFRGLHPILYIWVAEFTDEKRYDRAIHVKAPDRNCHYIMKGDKEKWQEFYNDFLKFNFKAKITLCVSQLRDNEGKQVSLLGKHMFSFHLVDWGKEKTKNYYNVMKNFVNLSKLRIESSGFTDQQLCKIFRKMNKLEELTLENRHPPDFISDWPREITLLQKLYIPEPLKQLSIPLILIQGKRNIGHLQKSCPNLKELLLFTPRPHGQYPFKQFYGGEWVQEGSIWDVKPDEKTIKNLLVLVDFIFQILSSLKKTTLHFKDHPSAITTHIVDCGKKDLQEDKFTINEQEDYEGWCGNIVITRIFIQRKDPDQQPQSNASLS